MKDGVITEIYKIIYEINNPRNDGWVRDHYLNKLKEIKKIVDEKLKEEDFKE